MAKGEPALKIIVIDDDPTGSQAVHSCPLLLRWDHPTLVAGLRDPSPLLFLLADTRALEPAAARTRVEEICRAFKPALAAAGVSRWLVISRGDSTLRGHFPLEVEVINQELGPFDATLLVPAFVEGGRTTVEGMHLLHGEPVHRSPFARDPRFGYGSSFLPDWIEARSGGRIAAPAVARIALAELQPERAEALVARLAALEGNRCVVADAETPDQLRVLAAAIRAVVAPAVVPAGVRAEAPDRPRRLLIQSAASLLKGLADLPPQPRSPGALAALRRGGAPGAVLVGSHVPLSDRQLEVLLAEPACAGVELPVAQVWAALPHLPGEGLELEQELSAAMARHHRAGRTPVLFTSRGLQPCRDGPERQRLEQTLAGLMARVAAGLPADLAYLISKGGTTTQTLLSEGLALASVRVEGQLLPGLSVLRLPPDHRRFAGLPLLTFPGNLGSGETLHQAWRAMDRGAIP